MADDAAAVGVGALRLRRSLAYVLAFACMGLAVGSCGPALPVVRARVGARLALAFGLRGLGGVVGSLAGGLALQRFRKGGHAVVAAGAMACAVAAASIPHVRSVAGAAAALVLLDAGCGLLQSANTLVMWAQPKERHTFWLNALNGVFGGGSLTAPLLVATVAAAFRVSHAAAVGRAAAAAAVAAVAAAVGLLPIPSPTQPDNAAPGDGGDRAAARTLATVQPHVRLLQIVGTAFALNASVGAETTTGAFVEAYVVGQQERYGRLAAIGERERDLLASGFWMSFTFGRVACAVALHRFERAFEQGGAELALFLQAGLALFGALLVLALPASHAALWIGVLCVGAGVAGLVAGFLAQIARLLTVTGNVTAATSMGVMTGVSLWQTIATLTGPDAMMQVVGTALLSALLIQLAFVAHARSPKRDAAAYETDLDHTPLLSEA